MLSDIFYGFGLIVIMLNIANILQCKKIFDSTEWIFSFKKVTGKNPTKEDFRGAYIQDLINFWFNTIVVTTIWMIFGLLSTSWPIFLFLIVFNIILNSIKNKIKIYNFKFFLIAFKSVVITSIITLLVINHFHLKVNLVSLIRDLI